jgi:hypothetical protein
VFSIEDGRSPETQRFGVSEPLRCLHFIRDNSKHNQNWTQRPASASELYRPIDCRLSAKLVSIFADSVCHVVSAKGPSGRNLGFLDRNRYFFLVSSSSVVLTRLSGPYSRPTTLRKPGRARNRTWTSVSVAKLQRR